MVLLTYVIIVLRQDGSARRHHFLVDERHSVERETSTLTQIGQLTLDFLQVLEKERERQTENYMSVYTTQILSFKHSGSE